MADTKISALTAATDLTSIQFAAEQGGATVRAPIALFGATQAQQEAASSSIVMVTPAVQQYHPSAAKFWAIVTADGATLSASYNLTSRTDTGTGDLLLTIATDFSSASWVHAMAMNGIGTIGSGWTNTTTRYPYTGTKAAGTIQLLCVNAVNPGAAADPNTSWNCVGFGDQ